MKAVALKIAILFQVITSTPSLAGDADHLGGSAILSFSACFAMNGFTNFEQPWFGVVSGIIVSGAMGLMVEAEQGFQGDYKKDLVLDGVGTAAGVATCAILSNKIDSDRKKEKAVQLMPAPRGIGAGLAIRF